MVVISRAFSKPPPLPSWTAIIIRGLSDEFMRGCSLVLLLLLVLCSCGEVRERADLVFIQSAEPDTLDPALVSDQVSLRISSSLFEGLCRVNEAGRAGPGMAERWDVSPDALTYTFHLRPGVQWSDGRPVTAQDFVRSWQRTLTPATAADYASQMYVIKGAKAFNEGTLNDFSQVGAKALSDTSLEVELAYPVPYFIDLCAFITLAPVPLDCISRHGTSWIKPANVVSNGPYLLKDWKVDDHVLLAVNPHYWDAANVRMKTVEIKPASEANTALNYFHSGLCDLLMDKGMVPPSLTGPLKQQPYFHTGPFLGTWFIRFNVTKAPFTDPKVRRAFALAIDKTRITQKITNLGEPVSEGMVPVGAGQSYQPPPGLKHDIDAARKLLAEAGYPGGKGFPTVDYLHLPLPIERNIAIELKSMWESALGVNVSLSKQEQKAWVASMRELTYQICRSSWVGDYNDPNTFLELFVSGNGQNRTGWKNPAYDKFIQAAAAERDPAQRNSIFQQAERLLVSDECAVIPVYTYVGVQFFHAEKLGGVQANLIDDHPFRCMYWK
jgi:oligopeptide transport system substrate-binding protein